MKNLQLNPYQCREGWGGDGAEMGWVGSRKSKSISTPPCGVGLKSRLIPTPLSLWGGENPRGVKWGGAGQARQGKIATLSCEWGEGGSYGVIYESMLERVGLFYQAISSIR